MTLVFFLVLLWQEWSRGSSSSRFFAPAFDGEYVFTIFWPQISGGFTVVFRIWRGTLLKFFQGLWASFSFTSIKVRWACYECITIIFYLLLFTEPSVP